ncbi:hypothetical protein [Thermomonas fusca]|uniref:hypothetical protein n=1 Tax=Thermomonas fusca TaxID=215690 RepID=UPI000400E999|nr:hypothetical protein [Thermomonas fusca]
MSIHEHEHEHDHDSGHDEHAAGIDARRWQAQERARRGEADADAGDLRIARALRDALPVDLPMDFAARMAARVQHRAEASTLLEQRLLRVLGLVFALSAAVVVAWYGRGWVSGLAAALPGGRAALGWCALAALCLMANWGLGGLRRLGGGRWAGL